MFAIYVNHPTRHVGLHTSDCRFLLSRKPDTENGFWLVDFSSLEEAEHVAAQKAPNYEKRKCSFCHPQLVDNRSNSPPTTRSLPPIDPDTLINANARRRLESQFGPYWNRFDGAVQLSLLTGELYHAQEHGLDVSAWLAPLAKALERVLHTIVASRVPTATNKWPNAPTRENGERIPATEWMIGGFKKFFGWASRSQEGKKALKTDLGVVFELPDLQTISRIRNLSIHDTVEKPSPEKANEFYRELMGSAATGRSLLVDIWDLFETRPLQR